MVWKLAFLQDTNVFSTTEMLCDIALYKFNVDIDVVIDVEALYDR